MNQYRFMTPEGTKDVLFEECRARRQIENVLHHLFKSKGYSEVMTSGIEFMDMFQSKLGYYPPTELYKMTDRKGRLLVLRPDSTAAIARVVATRLRNASLPLRLYYSQPVYRVAPSLKGRSNEISQIGLELLGDTSYFSDLEIATTAIEVLQACSNGAVDFTLELGDAGIFKELTRELNVSPEQREEIRSLIETKNYPALGDMLDQIEHHENSRIIAALKKLPELFGGEEVFEKAANLYGTPRTAEILEDLKQRYTDLSAVIGEGKMTVDLGMVGNADYYSGVILKGYLAGFGEEVLSGGRYNKLLSEFDYDIPAIGFAVNLDAVTKVMCQNNSETVTPSDTLIYAEPGFEMKAVAVSKTLRQNGLRAEFALCDSVEEARNIARQRKIARLVVVNESYEPEV